MRKTRLHFEQVSLDAVRKVADVEIGANGKIIGHKPIAKLPARPTKTNGLGTDSQRRSRAH